MKKYLSLPLSTSLAFVLTGCALFKITPDIPPEPEDPLLQELDLTVMHKADYNLDDSQTTKGFTVLESETDYRTELARYSVEIPRPVDFTRQRVVLSTMGTQLSGGFVVTALRAEEYTEKVVITVQLRSPGPNCITTSALSNPYEFVVLPTVKTIEFVETAVTEECG